MTRHAVRASWGRQPPPQGPSAPLKDAAAPKLDFSNFTCICIIIFKKLMWPKKMKTNAFREKKLVQLEYKTFLHNKQHF